MPSVIQNLCDPCFIEDEHVEGDAHVLTIDGVERVLILCGTHGDSLLKPLAALLIEHGAKPAPNTAAPKAKRYTPPSEAALAFGSVPLPNDLTPTAALALLDDKRCLYGCDQSFASRGAVGAHLRGAHNVSITQLGIGKRGGIAVTDDTAATTGRCDHCERTFDTPQGLGAHRYRVHGIRSSGAQRLPLDDDASESAVAARERSELRDPKTGKVQCPDCPKQFETLRGLGGHRNREHGVASPTSGAERKRLARAAKAGKS